MVLRELNVVFGAPMGIKKMVHVNTSTAVPDEAAGPVWNAHDGREARPAGRAAANLCLYPCLFHVIGCLDAGCLIVLFVCLFGCWMLGWLGSVHTLEINVHFS